MRPWEKPYSERFAGRKPRVCLGFVAFGDIAPEVFESCMHWAFGVGGTLKDKFEVYFTIATKREQYRARNSLVQSARELNADFILMVDDDHTLSDAPTMIEDFFAEEKPVQGGLYVQRRNDKLVPVIQVYDAAANACRWADWSEFDANGGPVDVLGGGLNWIDLSVFDFTDEPFWWPHNEDRRVTFLPNLRFGLDLFFCLKVRALGIQPWLNGKVKVGHVCHERQIIRPPGMNAAIVCPGCDRVSRWNPDLAKFECPCEGVSQ